MSAEVEARRPGARILTVIDGLFFALGAVAAGALAVLTVRQVVVGGAADWWLLLVLWGLLAYLLLPRLHSMLALVYVPDYFIGRTRTYEGLLGDPVNVALLGTDEQVHEAMRRAGWHLADELGFRSGLRIITSTLSRRTYPTAPVSPLFLFGRMQAFTYQQEIEGSPARRHHVRFWRTPEDWFLPGGARVDWLAAGTYDRSVGLSIFTLQITHKIDFDTDRERDHIVGTVVAGSPNAAVSVIRHFSSGYHSRNGGGDAIRTDGDLPVIDVRRLGTAGAHPAATAHGIRHHGTLREQARDLVETVRDTGASNRAKRPLTLYLGYGLMLLRVVVAGATVAAELGGLLRAGTEGRMLGVLRLPAEAGVLLPALLIAGAAYVALGQLAFLGRTRPRFLALALSVVGIVLGLLERPDGGGLALQLWLVNLVLDIGILVTLSGGDVRDFDLRTPGGRYIPAP